MHYLALCCIAKDEDPFLKEWIAYHALLGVERFYIYDNGSRVPIRKLLGEYVDDARVTVRRVIGRRLQLPAYNDCLQSFGPQCRWIGFLDLDEFICPMRDTDLRVLLSEFEPYAGLAATWHLFHSSGHLKRPEGPVIKNYTQAFARQDSFHVKCFIDPARTVRANCPHSFIHPQGHCCVNEEHYPLPPGSQCTFATGRMIRVNHYFVRSQQDYEEKLRRGGAAADPSGKLHTMEMFYAGAQKPWVEDRSAQRFLPRLESALRAPRLPEASPSPPDGADYQTVMETAIRWHEAGKAEKAQACLCAIAHAHGDKADFWTLRALLAQEAGHDARADGFIRRALMCESTETAYRQLGILFRNQGKGALAEAVDALLQRYPDFFS